MALANRALFGSRFEENNRPGIEMNVDGSMEVVLPDGTRFPLDGSGGGGPSLLGPFAFAHTSPEIGTNGFLLTTLDDGAVVLNWLLFITETWENSGGLYILIGDPNVSPTSMWQQATDPSAAAAVASRGPDGGFGATISGFRIGVAPLTDGRVYAQCSNTVSAGAGELYLLVQAPT